MKIVIVLGVICATSLAGAVARAEPVKPAATSWAGLSDLSKAQSDTAKAIAANIR